MMLGNDEVVAIIYRGLLKREPDDTGLEHWRRRLDEGADIMSIVQAIGQSEEARPHRRHVGWRLALDIAIAPFLRSHLADALTVVDIGAQNLGWESHIYSSLVEHGFVSKIVGFEPQALKARERNETEPLAEVHAIALGTGAVETFHLNNLDATSSLLAIDEDLVDTMEHLHGLRTVSKTSISTAKLDDIPLPNQIDLLKIDVQGFELPILRNGTKTLEKTLSVFAEMIVPPIYKGGTRPGDLLNFMADQGFALYDLPNPIRLSNIGWRTRAASPGNNLLQTDAIFLKGNVATQADFLLRQAAVAHFAFGWPDVAWHLLHLHGRLTGDPLDQAYAEAYALATGDAAPQL